MGTGSEARWVAVSERTSIGPHEVRFERDTGFIFVVHVGVLEGLHAEALVSVCKTFVRPTEPAFVLADDRAATGITPEARKALADDHAVGSRLVLAVFGASFAFRTVTNLVFTGMRLASNRLHGVMLTDEAEARAWLQRQKRALTPSK